MFRPVRSMLAAAAAVTLTAASMASVFGAAQAAWEPKKPIDFVIMAGEGGGADKMARLMQTIVEKHDLASKPLHSHQQAGRLRRRGTHPPQAKGRRRPHDHGHPEQLLHDAPAATGA